jgi:hypothetical protein
MRRRHIARRQRLKPITTSQGMEVRTLTLITGETVACVAEGRPPPSGFAALSEPHVGAIKAWANVAGAGYPCLVCHGPAAELAGIALFCGANPNVIDTQSVFAALRGRRQ